MIRAAVRPAAAGVAAVRFAAVLVAALLPGAAALAAPIDPYPAAASSYLLVADGQPLWAHAPELPRPPASLAKLMTALVLLDGDWRPEAVVTASARAVRVDGTRLGLREGESLRAKDALVALLVRSANDACVALAEHAAGSIEAFAGRMNERARRMGLGGSHFVHPCGLDAPGQHVTATDLLRIAQAALERPEVAAIVPQASAWVSTIGGRRIGMHNGNELLGRVPGVFGMKSGYTTGAGKCVVAVAERDGHRIWLDAGCGRSLVVRIQHDRGRLPLDRVPPGGCIAVSLRAALLLVAGAVLAAWLPSLHAGFQFDDLHVIVADARVASLPAWAHSMPAIRPLLRLSYALQNALGAGPVGFRIANVLVHAAGACLVLLLLESLGLRCGLAPGRARAAALVAALLFALHPAQTEAVTYVSGRSSSLSGLLALGSLLAWTRSFGGVSERARRALALALALAALGTKETAIALPAAMALWALLPDGGAAPGGAPGSAPGGDARARRQRQLRSALACGAVLAAAGLALLALTPYADMARAGLARRGPWQQLLADARALDWLLGQVVMPWRLDADPDLRPPLRAGVAQLAALALLALALVAAAAGWRRRPAPAFALLWFILWLLPALLLPRADLANDRQLYLPLVGPAWLVGWCCARAWPGVEARRVAGPATGPVAAFALVAALVSGLAALTVARNHVYATEVSFWEAAARASPGKARVFNNLGYAYAQACRDDEARAAFGRALALDAQELRARGNLFLLGRGELFAPAERRCAASPGAR